TATRPWRRASSISASRSTGCARISPFAWAKRARTAPLCRSARWSISSTRKCRRWAVDAGIRRASSQGWSGERAPRPAPAPYPHALLSSELDDRAVLSNESAGGSDLVEMGEHNRVHVGEHDPPRTELGQAPLEYVPGDVAGQFAGIGEAFDHQEIGAGGDGDERVHPLGVAGIGEALVAVGEHNRSRGRAGVVHHLGGGDAMPQHLGRASDLDLHHVPGKPPLVRAGPRKEHFERLIEPCACAGRSCDQQRSLALRKELGVQQEEGERAEMVAVQMRKHDAVDPVRIETARLERDERCRPAVDEQRAFRRFEVETGVEPAAGAEGITRSDDRQAHGQADALGRTAMSACQRLRFLNSSGTASFAGFMKSTATKPVMSATVNASPARNGRSRSSLSSKAMNSRMRGLLASAHAGTCGTSISFMAGCELRKTWETGNNKCSSTRRFHISIRASSKAPRPNSGGSGLSASK